MRSIIIPILIISALLPLGASYAAQDPAAVATEQPRTLAQHLKEINDRRETIKTDRRKAELLKDQDSLVLLDTLDAYLTAQAPCFEKDEEVSADICVLTTLKKLAEEHNFIAEHELGSLYQKSYGNVQLARQWYNTAMENNKTPRAYKIIILKDIEELNPAEPSSDPKPAAQPNTVQQ
jgi:hypothetical protein